MPKKGSFFEFDPIGSTLRNLTEAFTLKVAWVEDDAQEKDVLELNRGAVAEDPFEDYYLKADFQGTFKIEDQSLYVVYFGSQNRQFLQ